LVLVWLDVSCPDHLAPFLDFVRNELVEGGGRTRKHLGAKVGNPSRTRTVSISFVKPCASMIASVTPSGEPASNRSARR